MVTMIVGDNDEKRPRDEHCYISEKSMRSLSVKYVNPAPTTSEEPGKA